MRHSFPDIYLKSLSCKEKNRLKSEVYGIIQESLKSISMLENCKSIQLGRLVKLRNFSEFCFCTQKATTQLFYIVLMHFNYILYSTLLRRHISQIFHFVGTCIISTITFADKTPKIFLIEKDKYYIYLILVTETNCICTF